LIPLSLAVVGKENTIKRVGGNPEVKRHLENLGVVPGGRINIVSKLDGNAIINVKNSRIAISEEMARKIMV
jgi:ferrous iron transport protein A